jgi:cell division protein FtsQ
LPLRPDVLPVPAGALSDRGKPVVPRNPEPAEDPVEDQTVEAEAAEKSEEPRPKRRSRAVLRGARIKRRGSRLRVLMVVVLVAAAAAGLAWLVAGYFRSNPRYRLTAVELRGQKHLGKSEIEAVFKADEGRSIYTIPLDERRRQIEEISWVHHASVSRVLPGEIWVRVEERVPVAFLWSPRGASLIDGEGVVLDAPPETYFNLPVVRGVTLSEKDDTRRAKLQRLVSFMETVKGVSQSGADQVSEVNLADSRNLRAIVSQDDHSVLLHFGDELFAERFQTYQAHIGEWRRQFAEMQSIDLRYEGQAVIHSAGAEAVRVDSPGTKPVQAKPAAKAPATASRAAVQPAQPQRTPAPDTSDDDLPNPPLQQAGMGPGLNQ